MPAALTGVSQRMVLVAMSDGIRCEVFCGAHSVSDGGVRKTKI